LPFSSVLQIFYELLEDASAMLVALELIEARAGRCQQHDLAGTRSGGGYMNRLL